MLVIRGATVYPGEGAPMSVDVGVADGKVVAVGGELSGEIVEAEGHWLCPGFIDLHAHTALRSYEDPFLTEVLSQGVTTQVICPDGLAPAPVAPGRWRERRDYLRALEGPGPQEWPWTTFAEYLDALDETRPAISLVPSIGHGAARDTVIGGERRPATPTELEEMRREVRAGFEAGATNLSFGLVYLPGAHGDTDELVAVAEVAAEFGRPLVPHVRNEGEGLLDAIDEMLEVSRRSGASLHLSHLKSFADEALIEPLLEKVEAAGLSFDQYPYGAGCTLLASLLPAWAQEGAPRRRSHGWATRTRSRGSRTTSSAASRVGRTCSRPPGLIEFWSRVRASPTAAATRCRRSQGCCSSPSWARRWSCTTPLRTRSGRSPGTR
jgi:N-acyl-D-amino-acid deacylase